MSKAHKYQVEVLLRDVYEYSVGGMYLLLAVLLVVCVQLSIAIPSVAYTIATVFSLRGGYLLLEGYKLRKYQKNLINLQMYRMKSKQLKVSNKVHFLGLGFEWTSTHRQRIHDLMKPKNSRFRTFSTLYQWARNLERKHENSFLAKLTSIT